MPITADHQAAMLRIIITAVKGFMSTEHILHIFRLSSAQLSLVGGVPAYDVETQGNWEHSEHSNVLERHYLSKYFSSFTSFACVSASPELPSS